MDALIGVLFHGLAAAMILYVVAVGLSITMGMMNFVNLAHGVFAMAGGYIAIALMRETDMSFWFAAPAAALAVAVASVPMERLLYARLYGASELDQVLFTIGLTFVAMAVARFVFGPLTLNPILPASLQAPLDLGIRSVPAYRFLIVAVGLTLFVALTLAVERTSWGARLRATVDNRRIAQTVGIRTDLLFTWTFALGSGLAAFGGALGAEFMPIRPSYAIEQLVYVLIVVSIGGLGTIRGPFYAALLLGIGDTACKYFVPEFGAFFIFVALIALLLWRPDGLTRRA
jgi:branched-chain amino acid transport system permease protein